jgi:hypothetical protein
MKLDEIWPMTQGTHHRLAGIPDGPILRAMQKVLSDPEVVRRVIALLGDSGHRVSSDRVMRTVRGLRI